MNSGCPKKTDFVKGVLTPQRSRGRMKSGAPTLPKSQSIPASCIWRQTLSGRCPTCLLGGYPTRWMLGFAPMLCSRRWLEFTGRRSLSASRAISLSAVRLPTFYRTRASPCRWAGTVDGPPRVGLQRPLTGCSTARLWRSLKYDVFSIHDLAAGFKAERIVGE